MLLSLIAIVQLQLGAKIMNIEEITTAYDDVVVYELVNQDTGETVSTEIKNRKDVEFLPDDAVIINRNYKDKTLTGETLLQI